ncbi:MAG: anion permease [Candidatus Korobacteraceae bacterium]|jgi:L-tartrate/succinate antiporter
MASPTTGVEGFGKAPQADARNRLVRWLVPIGLGIIILLIPRPDGLTPAAWHYFALFAAVIAALITEPIPGPALGFMGVSAAAVLVLVGKTPAEAMRWALSGFSNDTVWLIFAATMFAAGYEATGLGRRIALLLVKALGQKTLGLGYAIAIADLVLAPFMPSNTARSGGTIYPVVKNIPGLYDSSPTKNPRKIGAYLCWTAFMTTCVTSAMFLTGMAPNLLACELAKKIAHVEVTWTSWMMGFLPCGLLMFLATPLLVYLIYPPEIKEGGEVAKWAGAELTAMGPISRREITMALLAGLALVAWIFGARWIAAVTVALAVISLMILTKVVSWNDIMQNKQGWNILVWFATLVTMAEGLSQVGFLVWFAKRSAAALAGIPMVPMMVALIALFFFVHYLFASTSAHTAAVLPVFLAAIVTVNGLPVKPVTLMLIYSIALQGVLTPYATGPAPIWYSAGYISTKDFWRLGFIFGVFYLSIILLVGLPYVLRFMR